MSAVTFKSVLEGIGRYLEVVEHPKGSKIFWEGSEVSLVSYHSLAFVGKLLPIGRRPNWEGVHIYPSRTPRRETY
jgi:hypothetical protein